MQTENEAYAFTRTYTHIYTHLHRQKTAANDNGCKRKWLRAKTAANEKSCEGIRYGGELPHERQQADKTEHVHVLERPVCGANKRRSRPRNQWGAFVRRVANQDTLLLKFLEIRIAIGYHFHTDLDGGYCIIMQTAKVAEFDLGTSLTLQPRGVPPIACKRTFPNHGRRGCSQADSCSQFVAQRPVRITLRGPFNVKGVKP
jgi:hypothetical protein